MTDKLIDIKQIKQGKDKAHRFVTQLEVDSQLIALTKKIEMAMMDLHRLTTEINAFIESYNKSIAEQNETNSTFARLIQGNRNEIEALKK